jgi:hypothetical protein
MKDMVWTVENSCYIVISNSKIVTGIYENTKSKEIKPQNAKIQNRKTLKDENA